MSDQKRTLKTAFSVIRQATFASSCFLSLVILGMIAGISFYKNLDPNHLVVLNYLIIGCIELNIILLFVYQVQKHSGKTHS